MNNKDVYITPQYPQNYSIPSKKTGGVNIIINGVNTPGTSTGSSYYPSPVYYSYPMPSYYPAPVYYPVPKNSQQAKPLPTQNISQTQPPRVEKKQEKNKPKKLLTPITSELTNNLNNLLIHGDKQSRIQAVAKTLKLLREDPETRKNDPRLIGLINTALYPTQPGEVKTAATIACNNGLIDGNQKTQQLLNKLANKQDKYGTNSLAASALSQMSVPSQSLNRNSGVGQRLNVISQ